LVWGIPYSVMMELALFYSSIYKHKKNLPKNIEYIDGGTSGMNLLHLLAQFDTVMLIDAVDFQGKPGDVRVFSLKDIQSQKKPTILSTHDSDFFLTFFVCHKNSKNCLRHSLFLGFSHETFRMD
jgi:hydrogenase maturation protease